MAHTDGSVIIKADIDDKQAQKELNALEKKIEALQEKLSNKKSARDTLFNQANNMGAQLDEAKAKLAQMKGGGEFFTGDAIKQQEAAVASMGKEWNAINDKLDKQNAAIREGEAEIDRMKAKAGELSKQLGNTGKNAGKIQEGLDKASAGMESFSKRVKMLAKRALVFTVIARALAALRDWLADVVSVNSEARDAIAQLKGALLTLAQPLVQIIIPAFTALVKVLAAVVAVIANIVSALFGTTAKDSAAAAKSLNDQKNAYKGVGSAAKSASKQLASFDEINRLSGDSGGGAGAASIAPDFSFMDGLDERLNNIAKAVALIGAGFGLWKISDMLPKNLGLIAGKIAGVAIAVGGLIVMWDGLKDAWENGLDWSNFLEILAGAGILVAGLALAFGAVGAGIGLVVAAAALFVTAIHDMIDNGVNLKNVLMLITGILSAGLGISILTKSWVPLIIAAIASIVVAMLAWTGNLGEFIDSIKGIFSGLIDFITGVFSGDLDKAFNGLKKMLKNLINADIILVESFINTIIRAVNWLISQLNKIHFKLPDWVPWIGGLSFGVNIPSINEKKLPRLATGAVIPPNSEFLAVLGDQKRGTNIEAPADLIRQIVREEVGQASGSTHVTIVLDSVDGKKLFDAIVRENNSVIRATGASPLKV